MVMMVVRTAGRKKGRASSMNRKMLTLVRRLGTPWKTRSRRRKILTRWRYSLQVAKTEGVGSEREADRVIEVAATGESRYSDEEGFISVDGEWARYGPLQVDVRRGLGRVFFSPAARG